MVSILRQIVSGPRARHPEARLDLCYVTDNIVVTSGPSSVWPTKAYRNPTHQLVAFLDKKHHGEWSIFEFRAEGTGYPDSEVYNRIHHFPWPDHHPPPFSIIPNLMAAMRNWLQGDEDAQQKQRVAVVHCKAGKGRSGSVACSYLISQEGWKREDALQRFTSRRMRSGFGNGVSIPSQLRWVGYVDRWTNSMNKQYTERPVEVVEIHVWGLRAGVKVCIEGYVEDGRRIHNFHTFTRDEKTNVDNPTESITAEPLKRQHSETILGSSDGSPATSTNDMSQEKKEVKQNVVLRPSKPVTLPTSDINIDFERRNKAAYTGFTMVTSIAHVWFNTYFEGGHEGQNSGVFEIEWEAMDGIKGSARKGMKALDRLKVVWKYSDTEQAKVVDEPEKGEPIPEGRPADWRHGDEPLKEAGAKHSDGLDSGRAGGSALTMGAMIQQGASSLGKELGLRKSTAASEDVSRASSIMEPSDPSEKPLISNEVTTAAESDDHEPGVRPHGPGEQEELDVDHVHDEESKQPEDTGRQDTTVGHMMESGLAKTASMISKVKSAGSGDNSKAA